MGAVCGKSNLMGAPTALNPGANPASKQPRRESERRGLRQGLVQKRERTSVYEHYVVDREIGHGMTGKVFLVHHKITLEKYALKCMEMRRIDPELLEDLRNEIEVLKMMDHPNVIKLYEYYEDDANLYLILEVCDGGELFDRLHQQKGSRYTEAEAARLMFKMCAAIGYCHFMSISHRDLKLENFIFESKEPDANLKLIDFGLSSKYGSSIRRMHTMVGTPYYIAPEVLNQSESSSSSGYTNACDCWSLGVIAYMLLSGTPPFKGRRDREVLQAVRRGKYTLSGPRWDNISEEAKDFIRHLLVYNPAKRMTAETALKHPWLQQAKHESGARPLDPEILTNLRDFSKMTAFKRAALEAIAFSMSAQSISHLREAFSKIDNDQTGFVTLREFVDVLQQAGMSRDEATTIFRHIDQDASNSISYTEFLAATLSRRLWLSRERIRDAFSRLDVDGTGYITRENLKEVMGDDWTTDLADQFFVEADTKGDGRIDFEEFMAAMTKDFGTDGLQPDGSSAGGGAGGAGAGAGAGLILGSRSRTTSVVKPRGASVATAPDGLAAAAAASTASSAPAASAGTSAGGGGGGAGLPGRSPVLIGLNGNGSGIINSGNGLSLTDGMKPTPEKDRGDRDRGYPAADRMSERLLSPSNSLAAPGTTQLLPVAAATPTSASSTSAAPSATGVSTGVAAPGSASAGGLRGRRASPGPGLV